MEFEWDPAKDEANQLKHGISFLSAKTILEEPHVIFPSHREDEERWGAVGLLNDHCVVVFFTRRENRIRIISIRRARPNEREKHRQLYQ
jgi:uncharacterized DUF497 family protein